MTSDNKSIQQYGIEKHTLAESNEVFIYKLSNSNVEVDISNYGCTIVSIKTPDLQGQMANIVAGLRDFGDYMKDHPYLGCIVGRYANRIAYGKCKIAGTEILLPVNDGSNHLHGGYNGFNRKIWKKEIEIKEKDRVGVQFSYTSKDGEEGYPGNLKVLMTFLLTEDDELILNYRAVTDKPTIVNLTNHTYFNLSGFQKPTIYNHLLKVNGNSYTEKNQNSVPTGNFKPVMNTAYDFLQFKAIGDHIHLLQNDKGYDINYVLNGQTVSAELYDPFSGRLLKVFTDRPGVQVYTANWWDGTLKGLHDQPYLQHAAVALETQAFPDGPNNPHFPDTVLYPGKEFKTQTIFKFTVSQKESIKLGQINNIENK